MPRQEFACRTNISGVKSSRRVASA